MLNALLGFFLGAGGGSGSIDVIIFKNDLFLCEVRWIKKKEQEKKTLIRLN
jgi:hypothetical protein